ncbi:MAG: hypothetical protein K5683_02880 [Prevotella sp.]|nr:hypothetical protein [Prevotella sp.]
MVTKEQIFKATNKGLDIICHLYPDALRQYQGGGEASMKKPFKMRNEKTPSAHIKETPDCWIVTDFGSAEDGGHARNPIDLVMREKSLGFREALVWIVSELNLTIDSIDANINKPRFEAVKADPEMRDGQWYYQLKEAFTDNELRVMGPMVTQDHVDALHWHAVEWVGKCDNRMIKKKFSTDTYPIFMRECFYHQNNTVKSFFKKYEPKNPDKAFRFMYIGQKPQDYLNGMFELETAFHTFNEQEQHRHEQDPVTKEKPYIEQKLECAVLCSGERDSLCARSLGYMPLWLNSETAELTEAQYKKVMRMVELMYNIPDKDLTGIRRGREVALRYQDIRTCWLPSRFERFKDDRGRHRKDFKDWLELQDNPRHSMAVLMKQALPAKFWDASITKKGEESFSVNSACLQYFLKMQGFFKLKDREANKVDFVRVNGNIVEKVNTSDIAEFLINWARGEERKFPGKDVPSDTQPIAVQNLIIDSPRTSPAALDKLASVELDFTSYTSSSQLFYFQDRTVKVTAGGMTVMDPSEASEMGRYVWNDLVIPHKFRQLPEMFSVEQSEDEDGQKVFSLSIAGTPASKVFCYLINSSRLYWQEELEELTADMQEEERNSYIAAHRFSIDGKLLSPEKIVEQKQCLLNKIFSIGYMLHAFKSPSRAWAPMAMDWKIDDDDKCNGRSGKSFLFSQVLARFLKTVKLSGRNAKLLDNPHVFDQVNRHTRMLLVDDISKAVRMENFYDNITSDMTVNPKNNQSYNIPYIESPKIAFTTNYVPNNFDASTMARLLPMVFSDYYHEKTEDSNYKGSYSIRDDFRKDLFGVDYTEDEWNADHNFLLQCEAFYLSAVQSGAKILPPMENIMLRKRKQDMSGNFEQWANIYFSPLSDHLDCFIVRQDALDDFRKFSGLKDMTTNGFTRKLQAFVKYCSYTSELNPADYCTTRPDPGRSNGRILKRLKNPSTGMPQGSPVDHIYVRTDKSVFIPLKREMEEREKEFERKEATSFGPDDDRPF